MMNSINNRDFADLYKKYSPLILRKCRFFLKDEEKAQDAMQDVFLRIIENQRNIKKLCASLFYVTTTRVCLNKIRSEKLRINFDLSSVEQTIIDEFSLNENETIEVQLILEAIFEKRDFKDKLIATLHFIDGLTLEETAKEIGMSVSGIRKRISAMKKTAKYYTN